jgi:hypothetical protein
VDADARRSPTLGVEFPVRTDLPASVAECTQTPRGMFDSDLGQPAGREDRDPEARLFPDLDEAALRTAGRTTLPMPP